MRACFIVRDSKERWIGVVFGMHEKYSDPSSQI